MLQPVALSHPGFRAPGLTQDGRGVVVGSQAALLLFSLDRLVSLLRLFSDERAFSDLLPTLHIDEVRNSLGARGYLLRFAGTDSRLLDRCAAAAAVCSSTLCVGTERHFVAYRDRRAPLGYDALELSTEAGDYVLYTAAATQILKRVAEVTLSRLLLRLQLLPRPGGAFAVLAGKEHAADLLWLLVPTGLLPRVLRFLWQRGVPAAAALPDPLPALEGGAAPEESQTAGLPSLIQLERASASRSQLRLLLELPGVRALVPHSEHLAVELGYAHPLRLSTFERLFDRAHRHLFLSAGAGRFAEALTLPSAPFVPAERLVELRDGDREKNGQAPPLVVAARQPAFGDGPLPLRLPLRLVVAPTPREPPAATLVPWSAARTLGRLLCLLPAPLLPTLRAACIDEGILLTGDSATLASLPLGRLFYAAAPSVLVPLGMELLPRLRGELLRGKLDADSSRCVVFLPGAGRGEPNRPTPIALAQELFQLAGSLLVARLASDERSVEEAATPPREPTLVNEPLGLFFSLWGQPAKDEEAGEP